MKKVAAPKAAGEPATKKAAKPKATTAPSKPKAVAKQPTIEVEIDYSDMCRYDRFDSETRDGILNIIADGDAADTDEAEQVYFSRFSDPEDSSSDVPKAKANPPPSLKFSHARFEKSDPGEYPSKKAGKDRMKAGAPTTFTAAPSARKKNTRTGFYRNKC